jgi:mannose-6-phosphate isomerase-like protein (cupin superfamily)
LSTIKVNNIQSRTGNAISFTSGDTITIPSGATFTNNGTATGFGKIGQVVSNVFTTGTTTSSSSFVTTSHTVSITPTSTSSKIWVIYSGTGDVQAGARQCFATLYRDSTNLAAGGGLQNTWDANNRHIAPFCMNYVDSPSTISSVSYTAYCRSSGGGNIVFGAIDGSYAYMTLMEVLA